MRKLSFEEACSDVAAHMHAQSDMLQDREYSPIATSQDGPLEFPGEIYAPATDYSPEIPLNVRHMGSFVVYDNAELRYLVDKVAS